MNTLINKILCGIKSPLGNAAEVLSAGTEIETRTPKLYTVTKCWCCTFWRGAVTGGASSLAIAYEPLWGSMAVLFVLASTNLLYLAKNKH